MRILASFVIGLGLVGSAQAQSGAAQVDLSPIPNPLPGIMLDPTPLSGSVQPLAIVRQPPAPAAAAAVAEAAAPETTATVVQAEQPAAEPQAAEPEAQAAEPEPQAEPEAPAEAAVEEQPAEPKAAAKPAKAKKSAPKAAGVTVIVENVESAKGIVNVALCDKSLSREGCPYTTATAASAGFVEARFEDVPPGVYAVVGYHDVNGNDEFDKMLGVPREPYALSNNAGEQMVPTFQDAALKINKGDNTVIIRLQRLMGS